MCLEKSARRNQANQAGKLPKEEKGRGVGDLEREKNQKKKGQVREECK